MNYNHIEYFLVLARTQHFTKAAELLHITQPTLSHAISNLETELNVSLFQRRGRNVVLTQYGKELVGYFERSMFMINEGVEHIESMKLHQSSVIKIGFLYTLSSDYIPALINAFKSDYGDKNIELTLFESDTKTGESTQELINGLKSGRFDIIFINKIDVYDQTLEYTKLFDQDYVVIANKESKIAQFETIDLKDLASFPLIQYANRYGTRNEIVSLFATIGVQPNIIADIDDELSIASLVKLNYGYSITPIKKFYDTDDLIIRPICNPKNKRSIYLGVHKTRNDNKMLNLFIDYIKNDFPFNY